MNDTLKPEDYFDDGDGAITVEPMTLQKFMTLAEEARAIEAELDPTREGSLAAQVDAKNDRLLKIKRDLIPTAMKELGLQEFTLTDGSKINVKNIIHVSIPEVNKPAAWAWLEENNFDAIIKTVVHADFGKGEMEKAKEALDVLREADFGAALDRNVHASTLKAFVTEQLEAGKTIPLNIFSLHQFDEAQIIRPRTRRSRG
jgi:cyanate lyase